MPEADEASLQRASSIDGVILEYSIALTPDSPATATDPRFYAAIEDLVSPTSREYKKSKGAPSGSVRLDQGPPYATTY